MLMSMTFPSVADLMDAKISFSNTSLSGVMYIEKRTHIWPSRYNVTGEDEVDISDNEVNNDTAEDTPEDVVLDMNDLLTNLDTL